MKKTILFLLFGLFFNFSIGQIESKLETKIYKSVNEFVANPTTKNLKKLELDEATFKPKSKNEQLALVILKCNKAYYQNKLGQTHQAIRSYENSRQIFVKNKLTNYDIVESCLQPLGNLYTIIGDYDNAENTIKQYYYTATYSQSNPDTAAQKYAAILSLSIVYQNSGKIQEAIILIEKTLQSEKLSDFQKGNLLGNLGSNYCLIKNFKKAQKALDQSIVELQKDPTSDETLFKTYQNLSSLALETNTGKALFYFGKAKEYFLKLKDIEPRKKAKFDLEEAKLLCNQQQFEKANSKINSIFKLLISVYTSGIPKQNGLYAETVLLDALDLKATIFDHQNQPRKAIECYQRAFYIEELFQSLLIFENSKIISQVRHRNRTEKCLAIYLDLFQKEKKQSLLEAAFVLQEDSKSSVLNNHLLRTKSQSDLQEKYQMQLQKLNNIIVKEQQKGNLANISIINNAIEQQNELLFLIKTDEKAAIFNSDKISVDAVFAKLEKDKASLISYFFGTDKIYQFVLYNKAITMQTIPFDLVVMDKMNSFLDYFSDASKIVNSVANYNQDAFWLYQLLLMPSNNISLNLIIIPDGILSFLPFEALVTRETQTSNFSKTPYLVHDFNIIYQNSATFYRQQKKLQSAKDRVLGIFPIFEKTGLELPFSLQECQNLSQKIEGRYLKKNQATFSNFAKQAKLFSILHLSTHASGGNRIDPASILFYDQEILYSELYSLKINPNLVVLSACETGIGKFYKAEGSMSIARGFQYAGAENLLFSLWKVNDFTTSVLMDNFYTSLKNNLSYSEANHQSKIDFLANQSISNSKKSPYYWSSFVYYGTLENKAVTPNFLWISICISILAFVLLILAIRKRIRIFKFWRKSSIQNDL